VICARTDCDVEFDPGNRANQKFHSPACRNLQNQRDFYAARRLKKLDGKAAPTSKYRGKLYDLLVTSGIGRQAVEQEKPNRWVADQVQILTQNRPINVTIAASMRAVREWYAAEDRQADWTMEWEVKIGLMLHREHPPKGGPELEEWLDEATGRFLDFEARFWKLGDGTVFIRKAFHRRWIRAILKAIITGGQLLILSPPRHGKTELLQHLCVWLICRSPNIRIIWVGPNGDIAEETVGAIREQLEINLELIAAVAGPGRQFAPLTRQGSKWSDKRFTVATRTVVGQKAPTMTAQGKGAKILSKDADLIIGDDIEDFDSTETAGQRESGRTWFMTQLESRKQVHTAWFCIGSRQHPDDLWGYLIDDPTWETIVESAHDQTCPLERDDIEAHVDCMLFPEINPYVWLYGKYLGSRARGQEHLYEMVYLNNPRPDGTIHWTRELALKAANHTRGLGISDLWKPDGSSPYLQSGSELHLIGGLDPSAVMYQAAFCWGIELIYPDKEKKREAGMKEWMIDLDNRLGGGVDAFLDGPGNRWLKAYDLRHWVIEDNLYRQAFSKHERLMRWAGENNITIEPIQTSGQNKWDKSYGVGAMRQLWEYDPIRVDLPYGTSEARLKVETYITQLLRFTDDASKLKHRITDLLMASWFPQRTALRFLNELLARITDQGFYDEFSYSSYDQSDYGEAPW
jgi:hypothetical protein